MSTKTQVIQMKRSTAANWASTHADHVLAAGEMGVEFDTGKFKLGDGVKTWAQLSYSDATEVVDDYTAVTELNKAQYAGKAASAKSVYEHESRIDALEDVDTIDGGDLDATPAAEPGD